MEVCTQDFSAHIEYYFYSEALEVNLFAFAYRLFQEDFSPLNCDFFMYYECARSAVFLPFLPFSASTMDINGTIMKYALNRDNLGVFIASWNLLYSDRATV